MRQETETTFEVRQFQDLTTLELYEILHLRNRVFVAQQKITAEPDVDGRDPACHHAMLWLGPSQSDDAGDASERELVGTARLFMSKDPAVIGRVAVATERQRQGYGTVLMEGIHEFLGARAAELHAQAYLEDWYRQLGWTRRGEPFMEADIEHVMMERRPSKE